MKAKNHIADLEETFMVLRKYKMKLNPGPLLEKTPKKEVWLLHGDGTAIVQGSGAGIVITSLHEEDMKFVVRFKFKVSNNETENEALTIGMRMVDEVGARRLVT
ncbi:UNVERIFIED_CONTAM: hypothetical protein Scaly_2048300 [Sesamum calycinum]|uniref:Reverse transcriptase domain-containing protein n=1 Tax=Sesamum calycinum TaxID=2727403 RepID=A0AAW2N2L3_9LAMI